MATTLVTGVQAAVGGGASFDIQPAAGQAYCITEFGSDQAFVGDIPDVSVALRDGVHTDAIIALDPTTEVQKQNRAKEIYIDNTTYLRVTNTAAGAAVIGWTGKRVNPDNIRTAIETAPNGGTKDIRPTAAQGLEGEVWKVTEIGAETMNATNEPDLIVRLSDGIAAAAIICQGTRDLVWDKLLNWFISRDLYLTLAPIAGADNDVGLCMVRVPLVQFGAAVTIGAGATVAIQPAEGDEAVVTEFAGETWAGIAAAGSPDITIAITDGATPATVVEPGSTSDSLIRNRALALEIDNTNYLQATDTGAAGQDFAYCGYIKRREHTT